MHSSALLRSGAADSPAAATIEKRAVSGTVAMRQHGRGAHVGENESSFLGQSLSLVQSSGAVSARSARRTVVEAAATFETQTKVALVRIGTRGRSVNSSRVVKLIGFLSISFHVSNDGILRIMAVPVL